MSAPYDDDDDDDDDAEPDRAAILRRRSALLAGAFVGVATAAACAARPCLSVVPVLYEDARAPRDAPEPVGETPANARTSAAPGVLSPASTLLPGDSGEPPPPGSPSVAPRR